MSSGYGAVRKQYSQVRVRCNPSCIGTECEPNVQWYIERGVGVGLQEDEVGNCTKSYNMMKV